MIQEAKKIYAVAEYPVKFICKDAYDYRENEKYDLLDYYIELVK